MAKGDLLIATRTAITWHDGKRRKIVRGKTIVRANDPIVRGREKLFKPVEPREFGRVEQATAEPGEKRAVGRPRKKAEPVRKAAAEAKPVETLVDAGADSDEAAQSVAADGSK